MFHADRLKNQVKTSAKMTGFFASLHPNIEQWILENGFVTQTQPFDEKLPFKYNAGNVETKEMKALRNKGWCFEVRL